MVSAAADPSTALQMFADLLGRIADSFDGICQALLGDAVFPAPVFHLVIFLGR
jgi:hypothetical protein